MRVEVASDVSGRATPLRDLLDLLDQHLREDEKSRLHHIGLSDGVSIAVSCPALEQSLTVMIRNAMDASPGGTPVKMHVHRDADQVVFDVIDQGHGMAPDVLKRAGDPFFTTKEPGRGMGLGLFLVRLVAENNGGSFTLASEPGKGTTSTLRLPLVESPRAAPGASA
jgi:signal transduction histidine kinase